MCNGPIQAGGWHVAQPQRGHTVVLLLLQLVCSVKQEASCKLSKRTLLKYHSEGKHSVSLLA